MIKIIAPIVPVTFKRPNSDGKRRFNPKEYSDFKNALGYYALAAMRGLNPLNSATKITAKVFTRYKPETLNAGDWDNHAKSICDALNGICYDDDRLITEGHIYLFKGEPRVDIELSETNRRKKDMQESLPIIARQLDDTIPIIDALCDNSDDTAEYRATIKSNINAAVCALLNAADTIADLKARVKQ